VAEFGTVEKFGYRQELSRRLNLTDMVGYGLIYMVPIAPFAIFGAVYHASGGMPALAYLAGAIALFFTANSYQQMARAFPLAGSVYAYAGRAVGASAGFFAGWAILLGYILVPALLYLVAAVAMNSTVPAVPVWLWLIIFIGLNSIVNLRGIRITALVTKIMVTGELIVLALFIAAGGWALAHGRGRGFSFTPLFNSHTFTWSILFAGVSVGVLSFLGFDGIAMLTEEAKDGARAVGRAMKLALVLAGLLFVVQVWVAALLVPDPAGLLANGDPEGTAFYDTATVAGGHSLSQVTSVATAISWGVGDTMVAQVAVIRLLYAMGRDRQLPRFLAQISVKRSVPTNATLVVAAISTALGLWMAHRSDGMTLLTNLINMGALIAFLILHLCVIVYYVIRKRSKNIWSHLVLPLVGTAILVLVISNEHVLAQVVGGIWIGVGVVVLAVMNLIGRRPSLAGMAESGRASAQAPAKIPAPATGDEPRARAGRA
jgi:amino acid transporter